MARPLVELITALRVTAERLRAGARYQWGHYGECNCGHLARTLLGVDAAELHRFGQQREGDWRSHAREYCDTSGYRIDHVIRQMLAAGLDLDDIIHLENLSDPRVLAALPGGPRYLARNDREDAILYLESWAELLAAQAGFHARASGAAA
ncbi:MAG: hypothetical protein R3A79_19200 [Nannocystaceae bacterium]